MAVDLAKQWGTSSWSAAVPLSKHNLTLNRAAFDDSTALRYGGTPRNMPPTCACGNRFNVEHALPCSRGGIPSVMHNETHDITATLLTEVCNDVCVEPDLQPLSNQLRGASANQQDGARLDISANGVGGKIWKTLLWCKSPKPLAPTNRNQGSSCTRKIHEREKKRVYEQRVREVEHSSFTPFVPSSTGGMENEPTVFYKRLA